MEINKEMEMVLGNDHTASGTAMDLPQLFNKKGGKK